MIIAKRINALNRVYNALLGIRRKDDSVPEKFFRDTAASPFATLDRAQFNRMIDSFYELRGWNSEGIPTKQNLGELGLEFAGEVLESRKVI